MFILSRVSNLECIMRGVISSAVKHDLDNKETMLSLEMLTDNKLQQGSYSAAIQRNINSVKIAGLQAKNHVMSLVL